ncbi:hypothetical protein C8R47DRAFT_1156239 [Mycena vitilis]|nr:hypothetical protein C8R47DRAFT_1156239 [Mycena vitilis]
MHAVAGLRQAYWILFTSNFNWPTSTSLQVILYNSGINAINTLVAVNTLALTPFPLSGSFTECIGWKQWAGLALFAVRITMELRAIYRRGTGRSGRTTQSAFHLQSSLGFCDRLCA